jgi:uncharacterized membrane protein
MLEPQEKKEIRPLFPLLLLFVAATGLIVTIVMGRTDLTVASLSVVIPLVVGAIVLLVVKNRTYAEPVVLIVKKINFIHLFLVNSLVFIIALIILVMYPTRPLVYFLLLSISSALLLLQIVSRRSRWTDYLILVEIMFTSLSLIWGVSLKYPLYFGDTDILVHLHLIDTVVKTGHTESFVLNYQYYPLFHLFTAMGIEITGMSARTALFVFMGMAWQVGISFAFLIFRDLSKSNILALIASLFFATSSQIIFYGGYAIARSLALVFFMGWLYLILRKARQDLRYFSLSLILMFALISTHHVNVFLIIPILLVIYICQRFMNRSQPDQPLEPLFILLLATSSLTYMIWVASIMSASTIPGTIASLLSMNMNISFDFTRGYGLSVILGAIYYSFVLLLCILGIRAVFNRRHNDADRASGPFALAGLCLLLFYIPSFFNLFSFSNIIYLQRFQLLVSPLVAYLMAYGIIYIFRTRSTLQIHSQGLSLSILAAVFVAVMTFFSMISTGNAQDYDNFPHTATIDTPYFTNAEIESFSFLENKGDKTLPLHSDYQTARNEYLLNDFADKQILHGGDIGYISNGYLTLRIGELERKSALTFSSGETGSGSFRYRVDPTNPGSNIIINSESKDKVYSDSKVFIFFINQ